MGEGERGWHSDGQVGRQAETERERERERERGGGGGRGRHTDRQTDRIDRQTVISV